MKKFIKKTLCIMLCVLVAAAPLSCVCAAGNNSPYPKGVSEKEAVTAVYGTDKLINRLIPMLKGKNLSNIVKPMVYNSETLSEVLSKTYKSLEKNQKELEAIGVDISVKNLSKNLRKYKNVSKELSKFSTWSDVDLKNVSWGVNDKQGFAEAMGAIFSPFNELLYCLLCSGRVTIGGLIEIKGAYGYENAIVPLLKSLSCEMKIDELRFVYEADQNKNNMVKNILLPLLDLFEKILKNPADTLTTALPGFAYFVESGEFQKSVDSLVSPITNNKLVKVAVFLKILNIDSFKIDVNEMLNNFISSLANEQGVKTKPVDLSVLAQCGTVQNGSFTSEKGKAYVAILRYLFESIKLNSKKFIQEIKNTDKAIDEKIIKDVLSKDTDVLVGSLILLFTPANISEAQGFDYPNITPISAVYPQNLTEANLKKVLKNIDSLLDDFAKEGGSSSINSVMTSFIYTNKNVTSALIGIYKSIEKNKLTDAFRFIGVDVTPMGVAKILKDSGYQSAYDSLKNVKTWKKLSVKNINWGFNNGSRRGFQKALVTVLSPLSPLLEVVLAEKDLVILDSIKIKGADGYNASVIPVLEALGCQSRSIKSYDSYKKQLNSRSAVDNILEPVFDLVDDICKKPVGTLTEILPNIIYFINTGSLDKCLSNLLRPVNAMVERIENIYKVEITIPQLKEHLDLNKIVKTFSKNSGVKLADFDINKVSQMGTLKEKESNSRLNGKRTTYKYLEANQLDVLMSMIRVIARTLKLPGNSNLLMSSMGSQNNAAFETYATSIGDKLNDMSEDELIEWLYQLFFKDRVKAELHVDEEYQPTIIYTPKEKNYKWLYILGGYVGVSVIVGVILYINRKKLYGESKGGSVC